MRKANAVISMGIVVLFLVHAAVGSLQLAGLVAGGLRVMNVLARAMVMLIAAHTVIGVKLTADTLKAVKKSGTGYFKENKLFWTRRISGGAVMLFIITHIIIFLGSNAGGVYRLNYFGGMQLASQILLVISLITHVITNIKPLMIALGTKSYKDFAVDIMLVTSIILVMAAVGFVVYFIRWL